MTAPRTLSTGFFFFVRWRKEKENTLTEERRQVRDGLQEQLRVHRLVRRQLYELVIQEKRHGPAVVGSSGSEQLFGWRENPELCFLVRWVRKRHQRAPITFVLLPTGGGSIYTWACSEKEQKRPECTINSGTQITRQEELVEV